MGPYEAGHRHHEREHQSHIHSRRCWGSVGHQVEEMEGDGQQPGRPRLIGLPGASYIFQAPSHQPTARTVDTGRLPSAPR